ncbi:hypothetical protein KC19_2G094900 [Ceratodon purpureus]|uniref:Transmembrane protein n=1 Tax=Ceratodon purpureus TaxID=3225 RepID=A0A8T0IRY3_CERPU|nr:hypothetical protein KC19_2G094900 [Ceratodon purpureus]
MKVNLEECETLLSSGVHHLSPPSLLRSKSGLDDMAGDSLYSPTRKSSKSESMSRVHCIPLLMVFVFFVLWAASSEVKSDLRMASTTKLDKPEVHLKVIDNEITLPGSRTMLSQDEVSHSKHVDPSLRNDVQGMELGHKSYIRGTARSNAS